MIAREGAITVERFMALANAHYYATRDPLGRDGDFTTAPEIHQMFGELVGAVLADCWLRAELSVEPVLVELGPGRGTLAADALRVLRAAGFAGEIHFVETSPALRAEQAKRVPGAKWHRSVADLPPKPILLVANEFLDALPVRQWVGDEERAVGLADGRLAFTKAGTIREDSPARDEVVASIARHCVAPGGVALIIDYGHQWTADGDTLQAVRSHAFADVLDAPGEQDLTAHVDFEAVGKAARAAGAEVSSVVEQGRWLEAIGVGARASALAARHPDRAAEISAARHRLVAADQMGRLFKVMAIHAPNWPEPAGFSS